MSNQIAELETQLAQAQTQREKIDALNDLAWEMRNADGERAMALAQEAYEMSGSGDFSDKPYAMGQASSLTTRAYLDRNGPLDQALDKCFQALALIETETPNRVVIRCTRLICWLYFYLGEHSNALMYGLKALDIARAGAFKDLIAAVQNTMTMIYAVTGDFEQALKSQAEALASAREAKDELQEMAALNQGANVYLEQGDLEHALDLATHAWEIAQCLESDESRADVSDTLGEVLRAMGDYERAECLLFEAIENDAKSGSELGRANGWLGLGKLHLSQKRFEQAEADILKSLELSEKTGSRQLQMECHSHLYQIAEQQEKWKQAFTHLNTFYQLYKANYNETASKKMSLLKVAHQVETAKRDAEIYHLRNEELLREIEERKKLEQALEEQAMTDPLSGLFNRRHFFNMAELLFAEAVRYNQPLSVMILDIDYFKQVNDTHGHAIGDEAIKLLASMIKSTIRSADIAARFGGDEFVLLMPQTNTAQAIKFAQRLRLSLAEKTIPASQLHLRFTLSIGVSSVSVDVNSMDKLLEGADRALYSAKHNGRNQVRAYLLNTGELNEHLSL
jgi:diguanylate cyclase (GGDEF)-like protein